MKRPLWINILAFIAVLFGLMTIKEGGAVLFTQEGKQSAGNYVPFVLWFNFIAGLFYVLAGIGIYKRKPFARPLSLLIAASTVLVFILFGFHVFSGAAYELRTVAAMSFRSLLWIFIAFKLHRYDKSH